MTIKNFKAYVELNKTYSKCLFKNKDDVFSFLEKEVFNNPEFIEDIKDTALQTGFSFNVIYNEVTIYLTDVLYEIDKNHVLKRRTKINMQPFLFFKVSLKESLLKRAMVFFALEDYLKRNKINKQQFKNNN